MATFTFSKKSFVPSPLEEEAYTSLTLPQRAVICQLDRHLRRSPQQQLNHREFIVITGEHGTGKQLLLQHMLFLLDSVAHTSTDFTYLRIRPGRYGANWIANKHVVTFGTLPAFYEEINGIEAIPEQWEATGYAKVLRKVKMVLIEDYHTLAGNDFSCLEYYLRRVATGKNRKAPFANCSIICLGNMYMPSPLTEDPLLAATNGPWAVLGNDPHQLYKENITSAYFLRQSKQVICPDYKAFLDRLKTGTTSSDDFANIKSRMISKLTANEIAQFSDVPRLFPYQRDADTYNFTENQRIADSFAARYPEHPRYHKVIIIQNGYEKLHLATGCKVTLSRDTNRDRCLKFGCVGTFISAIMIQPQPTERVVRISARYISHLLVKFDCCTNDSMGSGPTEYRYGVLIAKSWTKSYCFQDGRNKFVQTFPFISNCGTTHAAVQNFDVFPKLAIKLGQNELRENQDYSTFSKLTSFNDMIILDSYVTAKRMKVDQVKQTMRHQEFERLSTNYEEKGLNNNVVKYVIQRPIGGSGRPKRSKVTLAPRTYIDVESSPAANIRMFLRGL